jgi:uncharacterized protein
MWRPATERQRFGPENPTRIACQWPRNQVLWVIERRKYDPLSVKHKYEWHDDTGNWFRSYGNENWEFDANGFMRRRIASINDLPIREAERKYHWPLGRRPDDHPGLSDLGL